MVKRSRGGLGGKCMGGGALIAARVAREVKE